MKKRSLDTDETNTKKRVKSFSPQKETKQKFGKKTFSPKKNVFKKKSLDTDQTSTKNKMKSFSSQKETTMKFGKKTFSPQKNDSSPPKKIISKKESPGKQKIKKQIQEKLSKKTSFKKKALLLNKKGKKVKEEFPLDKDGKPQWKKVKLEKKQLKEARKVSRTSEEQYKLSVKAKKIWENLRIEKHTEEKKEALVNELFMLLKGKIPNVVHCHDMARVVQWMLKLGSPDIRSSVCEAIAPNTVAFLQSKYASFCVKRALQYGSKTDRNSIIEACYGHFLKLFHQSFASKVVELMYSTYGSSQQRRRMHREMYGEMHSLVEEDITCIQNIPDNIRPSILAATKVNLTKLLDKKKRLRFTLLQSLLLDFLTSCSEQDRTDILELIHADVLELLTSKEGSRVALQVVWHGTNKMKKVLVKALKGKVKETACSEVGHILLLALFDSIDDTVLVKKALIPEVLSEAVDLAKNEWGRKVFLYLVAHRDPLYFHPKQMEILVKGDAISVSKKDREVREREMLEMVSEPLLRRIVADPATWLGDSSMAMVTLAVLKSGRGEALKSASHKVVDYMMDPSIKVEVNERKFHVIEDTALHMVFKKLIKQHSQLTETDKAQETFAKVLVSRLTEENLNYMIQFNRGCFLLVLLIELECEEITTAIKKKITEPMKKFLQKQETTGAKVLLKKLGKV